jgi:hypothetical protein
MLRVCSRVLAFLLGTLRTALRSRSDLVAENPLLRHQLAVLTRPTHKRPRVRAPDKLLSLLARRLMRTAICPPTPLPVGAQNPGDRQAARS